MTTKGEGQMFKRVSFLSFIFVFAVYTLLAGNAKAQQIVTKGLVSYWTLDKDTVSGNTVKDIIGKNNGKINGSPKVVAGKVKEGMEFDGVGDFLDCGTDDSLDLTKALTIETWIKPKEAGEGGAKNAGPLCKAQNAWGWQLRYNSPDSNFMGFQFNAGGSKWISVGQKLNPGEWYHIVGTYDGSDAKCYLNGAEKNKMSMPNINSSPDPFFIAQDGWVNIFNGVIDEAKIYNRALTKDEITQNYNSRSQLAVESDGKLTITWGKAKIQE